MLSIDRMRMSLYTFRKVPVVERVLKTMLRDLDKGRLTEGEVEDDILVRKQRKKLKHY